MGLKRAIAMLAMLTAAASGAESPPDAAGEAALHAAHEQESAAVVVAAEAAEVAGELQRALSLFERAVLVAGHDQRAHRGLERVRMAIAGDPGPLDLGVSDDVRRQLAEVEVKVGLQRAEMLAARGRFEEAREATVAAGELIQRYPDLSAGGRIHEVEAFIARFQAEADQAQGQVQATARDDAQGLARERAEQEEELARSRLDARLARIISLKQRKHYELALSMSRTLVSDYPESQQCEALFGELLRLAHDQRQLSTAERLSELKLEVSERVRRSMIPEGFDGAPSFPADWHQRQAIRTSAWDEELQIPEWELALLDKLAKRVDVEFQDLDAIQAFEAIAQQHDINLVIDPELRALGGSPVSLGVRGMRLDNVFSWLARQVGTRWVLRNEAVWIGSQQAGQRVVQAYDATEFVFRATDFEGMGVALFNFGGDAGGGFDLFGGGAAFGDDAQGIAPEEMVDLIQLAVAPEAWEDPENGITIRGNWLIITAPANVHLLVREFLRSQALANSVVVRIGLQWLEINDDFIEEIGMDWRNLPNGVLSSPFVSGILDVNNEWGYAGSVSSQLPDAAVNLGQAAVGSGLQLSYASLALPAINAVLRAQQKKAKARVLDGIELTSLNGVQSSAYFGEQVAYVSDYEVAAGGNYDPVVEILNIGQSIEIKPHVSADRKFVTLDVRPTIASATFFTENIVAQRIFGRGAGTGGIVFTNTFPLELPNVLVKSAATRVMIPDQGTVLVGGFGRHVTQSSETQVPILGHIPFLGRLFGMRGRYSSKSQLYLSVSARIILYDEEEANL